MAKILSNDRLPKNVAQSIHAIVERAEVQHG